MRIAINLRLYVKGRIGGLENYIRHIVGGIAETQRVKQQPLSIFAHQSEVDHVREIAPEANVIPVIHETAPAVMAAELDRGEYDILFCPLLVLDPLPPKIPSAVMMPDLQHEFFPEFFESNTLKWRRQTYRPSALYADAVYTLSAHAKQTIVDRFRVPPEKIEIVPLGVDEEFSEPATPEALTAFRALQLPEEYLFFPANFWPHKNHATLLRAFQILVREGRTNLGLALTGAPSPDEEQVKKEAAALGLKKQVRFLGYQDRRVVVELYRHARALVFVSKFEGFGIPLLEAFETGTPVVTAEKGSCREVAGDAALLVDEGDPASIAAGIRRVLEDPVLSAELVARGRIRARQFSWRRALEMTLASFERIVKNRRRPAADIELRDYPTVSVVTPSFNGARFLEETIQSVLTQGYPHLDYIVMDGGSTDGTVELLRKYEGRLRYESRVDRKQGDAVNGGFAKSRGSIFGRLNAGDTYLPGALEMVVRYMLANPAMGAVYGEAYYVGEDGQRLGRYPTLPFDPHLLSRNCYICQPAAFIWRDVFEAINGLDMSLHYAQDYDLWIRIAQCYPMLKIDEYVATSRVYCERKAEMNRREVYREIFEVAKRRYGYVPYDWIYGYACSLVDKGNHLGEPSRSSLVKDVLTLAIGWYYNPRAWKRYGKEWLGRQTAIG